MNVMEMSYYSRRFYARFPLNEDTMNENADDTPKIKTDWTVGSVKAQWTFTPPPRFGEQLPSPHVAAIKKRSIQDVYRRVLEQKLTEAMREAIYSYDDCSYKDAQQVSCQLTSPKMHVSDPTYQLAIKPNPPNKYAFAQRLSQLKGLVKNEAEKNPDTFGLWDDHVPFFTIASRTGFEPLVAMMNEAILKPLHKEPIDCAEVKAQAEQACKQSANSR